MRTEVRMNYSHSHFYFKQMKRILIILVALLVFTACQNDKGLRHNAKEYIQAMADYRIDDAYPYSTPETQTHTLDYFKSLMSILDTNYITANTPATITIDSVVYIDDTSATVYFHKRTPLQHRVNAKVDMRLRDDEWLAHQVVQPAPMLGAPMRSGMAPTIDSTEIAHQ